MAVGRVFNVSLGREVQFYINVSSNTPAGAAFGVLALAQTGLEADTVLIKKTTVADLLSGTTNEPTNNNYARQTLTYAALSPYSPDNTNNWGILDNNDLVWSNVGTGDRWLKLVYYYDPNPATSTDATRVPITLHDFDAIPGGGNITAQIAGFCKVVDRVTAGV